MNGYTPTQKRILQVLSDGQPHSRYELKDCLNDELVEMRVLAVHLSKLRKALPTGETIVCELFKRGIHYRHVRLITNPYDGST